MNKLPIHHLTRRIFDEHIKICATSFALIPMNIKSTSIPSIINLNFPTSHIQSSEIRKSSKQIYCNANQKKIKQNFNWMFLFVYYLQ